MSLMMNSFSLCGKNEGGSIMYHFKKKGVCISHPILPPVFLCALTELKAMKSFPCPSIRRKVVETKMNLFKPRKTQRKLKIGDSADQGLGSLVGYVEGASVWAQSYNPVLGRLTWEYWESMASLGINARTFIRQ